MNLSNNVKFAQIKQVLSTINFLEESDKEFKASKASFKVLRKKIVNSGLMIPNVDINRYTAMTKSIALGNVDVNMDIYTIWKYIQKLERYEHISM